MNLTHNLSAETSEIIELVSDETTALVLKMLSYGITPIISLLGIVGNALSIMILKRHGLQKCSNVLLISLAFSDLCYVIGCNNIPKALYDLHGQGRFVYSRALSHFLFVFYFFFFLLDYGMGLVSLSIPMLITVERLVAVYLPLRFPQIITPIRLWVSLFVVVLYHFSYLVYSCFYYKFEYRFDYEVNSTVGIMARSALFYKDQNVIPVLEEVYFSIKVQPLFTLVGCVLIIIKAKIASRKRMEMTSTNANKKSGSSKTTQTLLSVCFVYIFVCGVVALPAYIPENYMSYSLTSDKPTNMGTIMYQVMNTVVCFNSSWNFIIYVALNKNFRDTLKEIMSKCR